MNKQSNPDNTLPSLLEIDWEAIDRTIGEIELPGEFTLKNDSI